MIGGFEKHLPPSNGRKVHSTCCQTQGERKEQSEKCFLKKKNFSEEKTCVGLPDRVFLIALSISAYER